MEVEVGMEVGHEVPAGEPVGRAFLATRGAVDEQGELAALGLGFLQKFRLPPAPVSEMAAPPRPPIR